MGDDTPLVFVPVGDNPARPFGVGPHMVTAIGAILCVLVFVLFWRGDYWLGSPPAVAFTVLAMVDWKRARRAGASSKWAAMFGRAIDLIHPPLWWWAWEHGLAAYGRALAPVYATMVLWAIVGGYVAQRLIDALFLRRFGLPIEEWRRFDARFRLVSAARNTNLAILVVSLVAARPDVGLQLVAGWTLVSAIVAAVRLAQATEQAALGGPVASWLDAA